MKKFFLSAFCVCFAGSVAAQGAQTEVSMDETVEYQSEENSAIRNWFMTVGGGGHVYFGDHDKQCSFGDRVGGLGEIGFGKWLTPIVGVRFVYDFMNVRGATKLPGSDFDVSYPTGKDLGIDAKHNLQGQKFNAGNFHLDAMFNMTNLFLGYDVDRVYTCSPYVGIGFASTYGNPGDSKRAREVNGRFGILNSFRINEYFDINLDIRGMYVNDRFDCEKGGRWGEGSMGATVGLVYRFKNRGFNTSKIITRTVKMSEYNEAEIANMRNEMNRLMEENKRMQDELKLVQNGSDKVVSKEGENTLVFKAAPNLVVFDINKSTLKNESRANLGMFAELIKVCDKNAVYTISGYADKGTGSVERNEQLSRERAQAVYDCLVNEFGVSPKQLKIVSNGGVDNMFYNDPRLSRAVISRAE